MQPVILKDYDPAELAEIEEIQQRCFNNPKFPHLHLIPPAVLKLEMQVIEGGEVTAIHRDLSRSWVRNNYNFMVMQQMGLSFGALGATYGAGTLVMKQLSLGTLVTSTNVASQRRGADNATPVHFRADGTSVSPSTNNGILVGTGTAAESFEHHELEALIENGTGAGQLSYVAMDAPGVTWDGGTKKFTQTIERYINNNSGGSITVNEVGLFCLLYTNTHTTSIAVSFMLARDLRDPGVAVPDTAQLKVIYTIESTVYPV